MSTQNIDLPSVIRSAKICVTVREGQERKISATLVTRKTYQLLGFSMSAPARDCAVMLYDDGAASLWIGDTVFTLPARDAHHAANRLAIQLHDERSKPEGK